MPLSRSRVGFPILVRELKGLSSRGRMFLLRTAFAIVFLGFVFWRTTERLGWTLTVSSTAGLGSGAGVFRELTQWLAVAVIILMPVITAGTIVEEKEGNTLSTLLTTQMHPFRVIVEKLLSRVWVVITLLLISMPLLAFAYSLGGVDTRELAVIIAGLGVLIVTLGALAMYWSVRCSSVVAAFMSTVFSATALLVPVSCCVGVDVNSTADMLETLLVFSAAGLVVSGFAIGKATSQLHAAASDPPQNRFFRRFSKYNTFFDDAGLWVIRDRRTLPDTQPITWRETKKRALSKTQHLVHVFLLLQMPVFVLMIPVMAGRSYEVSYAVIHILWLIAVMVLTLRTASVIPGERVRQTFGVLLATPLSGKDIVRQYMDGVHRTMWTLALPLLTVFCATSLTLPSPVALAYLAGSAMTVAICMPLCTWVSMLIGLRAKTQMRAVVAAVLLITGWIFVPGIVFDRQLGPDALPFNVFLSPTWMIRLLPGSLLRSAPGLPNIREPMQLVTSMAAGGLFYGSLLLAIRAYCLHRADQWLGRGES